jgi:serine/threonine protein kinase
VADSEEGVVISESRFNNNTAYGQLCNQLQAGQGGAIGLIGTTTPPVKLIDVNFSSNVAFTYASSGTFSAGGALITTFSSNVTASRCNFLNNAALFGGGDDVCSQASESGEQNHVYFQNCTFDAALSALVKASYVVFSKLATQLCELYTSDASLFNSGRRRLAAQSRGKWTLADFPVLETASGPVLQVFDSQIPFAFAEGASESSEIAAIIEALTKYEPRPDAQGKDASRLESLLGELRGKLAALHASNDQDWDDDLEDDGDAEDLEPVANLRLNDPLGTHRKLVELDTFNTLLNVQPDILISGGHAVFENPVFRGTYHVFFGDFGAYRQTGNTGVEAATNPVYNARAAMVGQISTDQLLVTMLQSFLTIESPIENPTMMIKQLNIFNGTLSFANDIQVTNVSFLYESRIIGMTSYFSKLLNASSLRPSNITFSDQLITGYALSELMRKNQDRLRSILVKMNSNSTTNSTTQSVLTFVDCNLVISGAMTVDSPYRGVFSSSGRYSEQLSDQPNSKLLLKGNASLTILEGGEVNIVTSSVFLGSRPDQTIVYNWGNITLAGTTETFLSVKGINVGRSQELATAGSLTSVLNILGTMEQKPSGVINLLLNHSHQSRPVLNLFSNKSMQGRVYVDFYTDGGTLCPNLQLYNTMPSAFDIIAIEKPVNGEDLLQISSPQGLTFAKSTVSTVVPSFPTRTVYENVLTVQNIGCDHVFQYYLGVADSLASGSLYPCYICLYNSSCDYCNGAGSCAVRGTCSEGAKYSSDCCAHDCNPPYGSCKPNSDYTSFSCSCSNWFYDGADCRELTVSGIIVILTACFVVLVGVIVIFLYRRSVVQKAKVLEELREGILRHTETANNEYIQNMQQALILNDVFVKYEEIKIESRIGEGSFGVVYKATFRGAQVAVKQMRSMFIELTDKDIDEFRKEAYMMSRLRHPNIVLVMGISLNEQEILPMKSRVRKHEEEDSMRMRSLSSDKKKAKPQKTVCIITEYLEQGSLADILYGPTKLPAEIWTYELILTCALQAARGMLYLHSHQPPICHRDLKSSNLVVDDHWVVKVTDFGMSRIVPEKVQDYDKGIDEERDSIGRNSIGKDPSERSSGSINIPLSSNTTSGASRPTTVNTVNTSSLGLEMTSNLGTTAWCAPEILTASSRTRYSVKVDVYSFGMVLWELWEKKRPFDEYTSRFDIIDAVRAGKRPPISESCPPTFKSLVQRCWQTEPSRRPTMNYIVRYLKDELGRVKRNKSAGSNQTTNRLTMSSYFRGSLGSPPDDSSPQGEDGLASSPQASSAPARPSMQRRSDRGSLAQSLDAARAIPIRSTERTDSEAAEVRNPLMAPDGSSNPSAKGGRLSEVERMGSIDGGQPSRSSAIARDSLKSLPEGRTPLVRAVDRSLSHLTESPSLASPLTGNYYKYSGGGAWRDRYVMKFSGWNSSNPDAGLPPSARQGQSHGGLSPPSSSLDGSNYGLSASTSASSRPIARPSVGPDAAPRSMAATFSSEDAAVAEHDDHDQHDTVFHLETSEDHADSLEK